MRILIAGKYTHIGARQIGGLQSWIKTVAGSLKEHDVTVWEPSMPMPSGRFGIGILANHGDTEAVWPLCNRVINVSHGIIPAERPHPADVNVFTSEGVRDHWGMAGAVIRQPIDMEFWRPSTAPRTTVLRYSYRAGLPWIAEVAASMGLKYRHVRNVSYEQAREEFSRAAVVLATGRAALEAMACGAPTVICDHRAAYQGPLLHQGIMREAMERNYSGRGGVVPTHENVRAAIDYAMLVGSFRWHVEAYHDVKRITQELLRLCPQ